MQPTFLVVIFDILGGFIRGGGFVRGGGLINKSRLTYGLGGIRFTCMLGSNLEFVLSFKSSTSLIYYNYFF